ncbi:hypothetical protein BKA70DRAFT_1262661, partial [Coprinopsis sp. MPI-PUGE-AT-0042]
RANGHQGIVALLLKFPGIEVLIVSNVGNSALVFAAANGYEGVVNRARHDGVSALMAAATNGHQGTVAVLLAHPEIQVNQRRNDGVSALMLATDFGMKAFFRVGVRGHVGSRVPLSPLGTPFGIGTIETAESSTSDLDSDSEPSV